MVVLGAGALAVGTVVGLVDNGHQLLAPPLSNSADGTTLGGAPVALGARVTTTSGGRWAGALRTSSRAAVRQAYYARYAENLKVPTSWTGSTGSCDPGVISPASHAATLQSLNFVRSLAGLQPVRFSPRLSAKAQQTALVMAANRSLSHSPPSSWRCWTPTAYSTAGRSNLALAYPEMSSGDVVRLYMDDSGASNTAAGHRRWVLNPFAGVMGNGSTTEANSLVVIGKSNYRRANPAWVTWPTAGWFPAPMEPQGRWSVSSGRSSADFSRARVIVRKIRGPRMAVTRYAPHNGYAMPTLVFDVANVRPGGYRVFVTGIRGAGRATMSYPVRIFRP